MAKQKSKLDPFEVAFFEGVREAYASIIEDYHFSIIEDSPYSVELRSEVCVISINREWRGSLISGNIKPARREQVPKAQYYNSVGLSFLIKFLDPETNFAYGESCPTPERMVEEINKLAEVTRQYCVPMMEGDFTEWLELRKIVMKEAGIPF